LSLEQKRSIAQQITPTDGLPLPLISVVKYQKMNEENK
jgi:hypothetical protein